MQKERDIEEQVRGFGRRLRAAREAAGLSQLVLAERAGVDLAAVSFLERAKRAPNLNTLVRVARAAEVPPAALLGETGAGGGRARAVGSIVPSAEAGRPGAGRGSERAKSGAGGRRAGRETTRAALLRFGANLRAARTDASMSQEELSAAASIDRAAISIIERGGRSANLRSIVKLADALGKQPAELLAGVE
jgi:transcriptional regulator with XRE-family HTH domain